ncbi:MAG: HlyD family efflux transporter periplasmic adaptor subunit [Lachnospiraceae bacterium]|nr:HlyD family efflux transporter periplasmic adaptor subunit [Lachnospiraceae bacterium]
MKLFSKKDSFEVKEVTTEQEPKATSKRILILKKASSFIIKHRKIFIIITLLTIAGIVGTTFYLKKLQSTQTNMTKTISTETIERRDLSNSISITGTIAANDSQTVYSNNSGCEVKSINVEIGDYVTKGDTICILDSTDYEDEIADIEKSISIASQKSQLSVAQADRSYNEAVTDATTDIAQAQATVDDAVEDYTSVADAKSSAYNDYLLAVEDKDRAKEEYEKAKTKLSSAKKEQTAAKEEYEKAKTTLADTVQTDPNYQTVLAAYNDAEAAYNTANDTVTSLTATVSSKQTAYETAEKTVDSAESTYESYGDKIESAVRTYEKAVDSQEDTSTQANRSITSKADSVTSANLDASTTNDDNEKKIEEYEKLIDKCTVTAPISGVVTSIGIEVGDEVSNENNEICVIQDDSSYIVEATVDQYDISDLYKGMTAVIKTDATDDLEMAGVVTFVAPTPTTSDSDTSTGQSSSSSTTSYSIKISITDKNDKLRIGMTAETSVLTESVENVLAVPYDCIEENENGESIIYVVDNSSMGAGVSTNKAMSDNVSDNTATKDMPSERPDRYPDNSDSEESTINKRAIVVETGLETDYYTEIKSDEISEGMQVIVPNSVNTNSNAGDSDKENSNTSFSIGGGMGGTPSGGGGMGGGPGGGF